MNSPTQKSHNPLSDLTDIELLCQARKGSEMAFELVVRRHNQTLFRAAKGILGDDNEAQETVQEAYLKAFTHMDSFQQRASLKTWLTRITINEAISFKRRKRPLVSLDQNTSLLHSKQSEEDGMASYITDKQTPDSVAYQQEMKHLLESAIQRLPDIYRSVFILRAVEGMSVIDTAFCLKTNESVIKKRFSRAREMLRKDLMKIVNCQETNVFEFAGKRCDAITSFVMSKLVRQQLINVE